MRKLQLKMKNFINISDLSKNDLRVIIDGAQSFGSQHNDKYDSSLGDISTTSFFPAKPLGCYGDGGAIFTNNHEYIKKIIILFYCI